MLQNIWEFLVGLASVVGLIILYLDFASNAANPTVANTGSYFFELGLGLALGGGIWAVIQVRQALGLAKPEGSGEPRTRMSAATSGARCVRRALHVACFARSSAQRLRRC